MWPRAYVRGRMLWSFRYGVVWSFAGIVWSFAGVVWSSVEFFVIVILWLCGVARCVTCGVGCYVALYRWCVCHVGYVLCVGVGVVWS
eukprot:m.176539 g.176539  ORF g.176539 m.176539 type:complete len:87 (+) comp31849_c6_seq2:2161-2421(+)